MSATTQVTQAKALFCQGKCKRTLFCAATLLLSVCYIAPRASATIYTLSPGANVPALASTFPTGGTMLGTETSPFSTSTLNGTLTSTVYRGDASNPYGGLTFTYLIQLNSSSTDSSSEFSVGGYAGFLADVTYNQTGAEVAPSNFLRSGNGAVIHSQWNTSTELPSGDTGALVVVQTSAQNFGGNFGSVIDSTSATVNILAPVPEPGIGTLLVAGFGTLLIFRRRGSR